MPRAMEERLRGCFGARARVGARSGAWGRGQTRARHQRRGSIRYRSFGAGRFEPARTVATPTEQRMTRGRSRPLCAPQFLRPAERTMPRAAGPQTLLRDGSRELLTARTEACTGGSGRSWWRHRGREHLTALRIGAIRGARGAPFDARLTGWVLQRNVQLLREPYVRPRGRKAV